MTIETKGKQLPLLAERRMGPLWLCQLTNSFNSQLLRAATLWVVSGGAYAALGDAGVRGEALVWFAVPALLMAVIGGQLADKLDRALVLRICQGLGLLSGLTAIYGLLTARPALVLIAVAVAGMQATIFGPAQGALLRQHLGDTELTAGNGLMSAARQIAMVLAMVLMLMTVASHWDVQHILLPALVISAVLGLAAAFAVPRSPAPSPELDIAWRPVEALRRTLVTALKSRGIFLAILGVSWFWFTNLIYIVNLPAYASEVIGAQGNAVALLQLTPPAALIIGSLLCHPASGRRVELGLVPLGAIGMTLAGIDFYLNSPQAAPAAAAGLRELFLSPTYLRCLVDLFIFGVSAGLFVVPLYALIQQIAPRDQLGRILGGMYFYNLAFIGVALAGAQWLRHEGLSVHAIVLIATLMQACVAVYIFLLLPEFLLRLVMWLLVHTVYRMDASDLERVPAEGPAVLVCNHVSYMDALVIGAKIRRPVRFVMHKRIFQIPILKSIFGLAKAIPIVSAKQDPEGLQYAFDQVAQELSEGRVVGIFPEGKLTLDGEIGVFRGGIEKIIERNPVPVVPIALQGLWDSVFSMRGGKALSRLPRLRRARIALRVGEPVLPEAVSVDDLRERVAALRGDLR